MTTIIIKKVKKAGHAHHGGAWKIAYADFVTAMMAFFLLMWLISMTTQEQKNGLAEYFAPSASSPATSGAGGMLYGTALDTSGNKASTPRDAARGSVEREDTTRATTPGRASDLDASRQAASVQADYSAIASLRQALQTLPDIAELSKNIVIEPTKEGVNVSLVDQDGRSMFREGSVEPHERTRRVLETLAPALRQLPNRLSVTGHTSATRPGSARVIEPWNLTAGRALAVREILAGSGVPNDNFTSVVGRADTEPVYPDNPYLAPNRRVTITLLHANPPVPANLFR
ncbi:MULTISPECIES: flagellar motor protein MotB [unclassified Methylobacterium]|uniref:flagellar motor protein MotB n=1 Tax=unclassified Methylobacterium TaxID=2615210 RepID=UPI0011C201DF|nr:MULTISPECIES: flagellar motor protein MotB [unclassified Methylobacterium]QEE42280.1 OmpA family protein [Methylobacterium sp. WL1]TXN03561.1 OmpA family protein [Methylobacterium sp. WL64]TXN54663.1 OmpA family protein [Methylobacterium sp. WL2]